MYVVHETTFSSKASAVSPPALRLNRQEEALKFLSHLFVSLLQLHVLSETTTHILWKSHEWLLLCSLPFLFASPMLPFHFLRKKPKNLPFLSVSDASKYPTMTAEWEKGKKCVGCRPVVKRAVRGGGGVKVIGGVLRGEGWRVKRKKEPICRRMSLNNPSLIQEALSDGEHTNHQPSSAASEVQYPQGPKAAVRQIYSHKLVKLYSTLSHFIKLN